MSVSSATVPTVDDEAKLTAMFHGEGNEATGDTSSKILDTGFEEVDGNDWLFVNDDSLADFDFTVSTSTSGEDSSMAERDLRISKPSKDGRAALHIAAENGLESIANVLLRAGAELNLVDGNGRTALHCAIDGGHVDTLRLLLSCGADPLVLNSAGLNSLHLAVNKGELAMVQLLIDHGVNPNMRAGEG